MPRGGKRHGAGRRPGAKTIFTKTVKAALKKDGGALTAARVLEEIRRLAFSDIGELYDKHGWLKPMHSIRPAARAFIASAKTTKKNLTAGDGKQEDVVEVRLWDKLRALEMAAKYHGLLTEKVEISGADSLAEKIARARQRLSTGANV